MDRLQLRTRQLGADLDCLLLDAIPVNGDGKDRAGKDRAGKDRAGKDRAGEDRLGEAMRYAVVGGGKRFRAALVVATGELVGASYQHVLRVGAAIECVHAQSLVHDDLPCMDDDDMRRGKPALHKAFDEATAVLAGDALLAIAFELLGNEATHPDCSVRIRLVTQLARAIGQDGLARGQMMDLYPPLALTAEHTATCQRLKTASLIHFALEAGAMLGKQQQIDQAILKRFALSLGRMFQVRDDLLDRIGDEQQLGKKTGKDDLAGRPTTLRLLGIDEAIKEVLQLSNECEQNLNVFGPPDCLLRDIAVFAANRFN